MPVHTCGSRCAREGTSSEADPARGRRGPSSEADPARGRRGPSSETDLTREQREPSSEADLARGGVLLGRFGWPRGPPRRGLRCVYILRFRFFAGFKQDSPRYFREPSWLSPTQVKAINIRMGDSSKTSMIWVGPNPK
jgi:hypothetical protein